MRIFLWGVCILGIFLPDIAIADGSFRYRRQDTTPAPAPVVATKCVTCFGHATCDKPAPTELKDCAKMAIPDTLTDVDQEKAFLTTVDAKLPAAGFTHCVLITFKPETTANVAILRGCVSEKIDAVDTCKAIQEIPDVKEKFGKLNLQCKICKANGALGCNPDKLVTTAAPKIVETTKPPAIANVTAAPAKKPTTKKPEVDVTTHGTTSPPESSAYSFLRQGISVYYWIVPVLVFCLVG